jgi:MraZ protein
MLLLGRSQHSLDDKNRIVLPASYRDLLHGPLYFALGEENQVAIWPEEAFAAKAALKKERELTGGPEGRREHLRFTMNASVVKIDAQFRVPIPENLRNEADLDRSRPISIVGANDRIEIWDTIRLDAYLAMS